MATVRNWNRHTILAELRSREMTLAGLAETYKLPVSSVKNIWTRPNERVERAIAAFLGEDVKQLFPKRYPKMRNRIFRPITQDQTQSTAQAARKAAA